MTVKKEKWILKNKKAEFHQLAEKYNISPILVKMMVNRGLLEKDFDMFLKGTLGQCHDPFTMKDIKTAKDIILDKIKSGKKIRVIGDYDIDGVCASYILSDGLEYLGAEVDVQIPERIKDGYGINNSIIEKAIADGVDTIITCDNGISAIEQAQLIKENNITYIVTDHHEIMYKEENDERTYILPQADAIINPKQVDCPYPFKGLCGAAVAYKLITTLVNNKEKLDEYLVFAAIATIGDIMELKDENRIIVKYGLKLLNKTDHIGLSALIEELELKEIKAYHIGFVIGPCINAGGRLETAEVAYSLMRAKTVTRAKELAKRLVELNGERKEMTEQQTSKGLKQVEAASDKVIVTYLENCHESIAGIVAGRIREATNKPTFVVTDASEGLKGSGRSIEGYNMYEEMTKVKQYLSKYGGHKMAAGFSFDNKENMELFRKAVNENCTLTEEDLVEKIIIDIALSFEYLDKGLIHSLEILEPFGNGNEKPIFALKNLRVNRINIVGKEKNSLALTLVDEAGYSMKAMYFSRGVEMLEYLEEQFGQAEIDKALNGNINNIRLNITYYPTINEYRGEEQVNIIIGHYC